MVAVDDTAGPGLSESHVTPADRAEQILADAARNEEG